MAQYPLGTGGVADVLGVTELRLQELLRKRQIEPPPPLISNRRMWSHTHALQAAKSLGLLSDAMRAKLAEETAED